MFPKPEPRAKVKARTVRQFAAARAKCIAAVWKRDGHVCQRCGIWLKKHTETDNPFLIGHVHEIVPRSRGGDPTNPDECELLCEKHHREAHGIYCRD